MEMRPTSTYGSLADGFGGGNGLGSGSVVAPVVVMGLVPGGCARVGDGVLGAVVLMGLAVVLAAVVLASAVPASVVPASVVEAAVGDAAVVVGAVAVVEGIENTGLSSMELTVTSPVLHPPSNTAATEPSAAASSTPRGTARGTVRGTVRGDDEGEGRIDSFFRIEQCREGRAGSALGRTDTGRNTDAVMAGAGQGERGG